MKKLTQTRRDNCWQTCVAMLLGCPAESLPAQHEFVKREDYGRALRVYLDKHHALTYVEMGAAQFSALTEDQKKLHVMIGECERTTPENGNAWHAVVGASGELLWDVSESRAGLTKVHGYGLLVPTPLEWRATWAREICVCSECAAGKEAIAC